MAKFKGNGKMVANWAASRDGLIACLLHLAPSWSPRWNRPCPFWSEPPWWWGSGSISEKKSFSFFLKKKKGNFLHFSFLNFQIPSSTKSNEMADTYIFVLDELFESVSQGLRVKMAINCFCGTLGFKNTFRCLEIWNLTCKTFRVFILQFIGVASAAFVSC